MSRCDDAAWVDRVAIAATRPVPSTTGIAERSNRWIVAYSGGVDSTVLLHVLRQACYDGSVVALHVHHGLHPHADDWAAHCQQVCDALDVPLTVVRVTVDRASGEGVEAAARRVRYAAFETAINDPCDVLVAAHHRDDQSETFLLRALRASGADGLGAMREWRELANGWLWRPLLDVPRTQLLAYAQHNGLAWIDDPSNLDTDPDRNFLRHAVFPLLRERWPAADAAFARSAALLSEAASLLEAQDAASLAEASTIDPNVLSLDRLHAMPPARRARVLRSWIAALGLPPLPGEGIARIESDLFDARADADAAFAWSDVVIRRWRDVLHADRRSAPLPDDFRIEWSGADSLLLPTGDRLALLAGTALAFDAPVLVHGRQGGERIALPGRDHSHALKHVLQNLGVPRWERERLPLLSSVEGDLLAAGDLVCSALFDAWQRARGCRLQWTRDPANTMP